MPSPILVLNSQTHYVADGSTTTWNFNFAGGYISKDHVKAYKVESGTELIVPIPLLEADIGEAQVSIIPALTTGASVVIYRDTPKDMPLVDYTNGQGYDEASLDTTAKQAVFIAAEVLDRAGQALNVGGGVTELQEVLLAAPGAGLVGFIPGTVYPANTVGAALTGAVDAIEALEAIPTNAVDKDTVTEQVMNGDLTIQRDAARIRLQSDTTPANTLDLGISGGFAYLTLGGALDLNVIGPVAFVSRVNFNGGIRTVGPSAIDDDVTVSSGNTVEFQAGADLTIADAPVAATDAVNKAYVDGRVSITSLRLVTSQTSGAGLQFDTAYRNDNNYWNAGTKYVNAPNKHGAVTVNVNVNNGNAAQVTRTLTLEIAGVERAKVRVDIPSGTQRVVGLSYTGPLSGRVEVEIDDMTGITFMGSNSGPTTTNFGMVIYA